MALGTFKIGIGIGNVISATVSAIRSFTTATKEATTAQAAFNAVGAANKYVFIASVVLTAIAGIATYVAKAEHRSVQGACKGKARFSDSGVRC